MPPPPQLLILRGALTAQGHLIQQLSQGKMENGFYPECQGASKELDGVERGRDDAH